MEAMEDPVFAAFDRITLTAQTSSNIILQLRMFNLIKPIPSE